MLQDLMNGINDVTKQVRADYHLTLGELINKLEGFSPGRSVYFPDGKTPGAIHSYRGHYSDLAFADSKEPKTVRELRELALSVLDTTLQGYKGGEYTMDSQTPLWRSERGSSSGIAIIDIQEYSNVVLMTKQIEDKV